MKIAVIGSGGREHALLRKLCWDDPTAELLALPGNGGTRTLARNIACDVGNSAELLSILRAQRPDLSIVGPEIPLANGLVDRCIEIGLHCFGPTQAAAQLESSKAFAKSIMRAANVPTARSEVFTEFAVLRDYITAQDRRNNWVVKADGLAGGKGAVVCDSPAEAIAVGKKMLVDDLFGAAGRTVVLEERLAGRELSCMYFCDGENFRLLPIAQDYKRIFDGDGGGNTGGMGSLCPSPFWTPELATRVAATIITPVLRTMRERGTPYQGILYAGLMLTEAGPQVIEFNCRLGDPETQTMLAIWPGNFAQHALACVAGDLSGIAEPEAHGHAVCVVLSAEGYPDTYTQGIRLALVADDPASYTLHAGTVLKDDACISTGGRVLNAIGIGSSLAEARAQAYALTGRLRVPRLHYRTDIGL